MIPETAAAPARGRILVCDDDQMVRRAYSRVLRQAGFDVTMAEDGSAAAALLTSGGYDAVLTDISMPGMGGLDLLKTIRTVHDHLPVVLITANAQVESAIQAMEFGAHRYLIKPVDLESLVNTMETAVRTRRATTVDRLELEERLERAISQLWIAFQPIVSVTLKKVYAYEALVRSAEPTLPNPHLLFTTAEKLGKIQHLGRAIRRAVADRIPEAPPEARIFVNLHPQELLDDEVYSANAALAPFSTRITFEVTEHAALEGVANVRSRIFAIRARGYGIAVDDLGSGWAGLSTVARLSPDVVKVDQSLTRDVHLEPMKQRVMRSIAELCQRANILPIVEGIEKEEERDAITRLGFSLQQGYYFARPQRGFVSWS